MITFHHVLARSVRRTAPAAAGDVQSPIAFLELLPTGSNLMAFDLDWRAETFLTTSRLKTWELRKI